MTITVSDHLIEILTQWGGWYRLRLRGDGISSRGPERCSTECARYVHCRHEETAALAASAYAKFSGPAASWRSSRAAA